MEDILMVWILEIINRYGTDIYVHRTADGALASLADYVNLQWEDARSLEPLGTMPDDPDEAVDLYFESCEEEWYNITFIDVGE